MASDRMVRADGLKDTIQCAFTEMPYAECVPNFIPVDPIASLGDAVILRELVAQEGLDQCVDVNAALLVLSEDVPKLEITVMILHCKDGSNRKRYILGRDYASCSW